MNAVCVYASKTGHSKKLARAVSRALGLPVYGVGERPVFREKPDLLVLFGGIYAGKCSAALVEYAAALSPEQVGRTALVCSSTEPGRRLDAVREALTARELPPVGEHWCPGSFLLMARGRPNDDDCAEVVAFVRGLLAPQA